MWCGAKFQPLQKFPHNAAFATLLKKNAKRVSNSRKIVQLDFCFLKKKIKIKTTNLNIDEHYKNLCKMIQNLSQMRFQMLKFFKPKMCIEHEKSFFVLTLLYETHESLVLQS